MKAVIPVAGSGRKLRPHTHTQPKSLIPVAGNTILGHIIERLQHAGIQDFVFIIGYLGGKVEAYVKRNYPNIRAEFVVQEPREGLGHALWVARENFRHEESILIMLGDAIVDVDLQKIIESPQSVLCVKKVNQPSLFGIIETDEHAHVTKLVEKPSFPKSNYALVGLYKIAHPEKLAQSLEYIIKEGIKTQHEYHLTDALTHLIEHGEKISTCEVDHWYDCGRKESLLQTNAILLNRPEFLQAEKPEFPNTIIIPPVSIGQGCTISNSIIGPNVAIGQNTIIDYTVLQNSIIGEYSELRNTVMHDSIIGNDSSLKGLSHSLNIGDNTEINFSER
jgi:glucose-1-phosphate thymidylyltransferase